MLTFLFPALSRRNFRFANDAFSLTSSLFTMSHNERGQTSRPFVKAEIQTDYNFEVLVSYHNSVLGYISRHCFIVHFGSPCN